MLEQAAGNWTILIYGGIYEYRRDFDMLEIEGGYIDLEGDKREFVRTVSTDLRDSGKALLLNILGADVFKQCPVALLNATGDVSDPFVTWLSQQPSIHVLL